MRADRSFFRLPKGKIMNLNISEVGGWPTGAAGMGYPHNTELIMHWIDVCTDPAAHNITDDSALVTISSTHRDQLVAVWIEQDQESQEAQA
jgi:hypothetical protein